MDDDAEIPANYIRRTEASPRRASDLGGRDEKHGSLSLQFLTHTFTSVYRYEQFVSYRSITGHG